MTEAFSMALIAELAKKTGVCWLRYDAGGDGSPARPRPAWHVWYDDALHILTGGQEQPLPGLEAADRVEVTMRSKENGGRLLTWTGRPSVVRPDDEAWDAVTDALVSDRLNLEDLGTAKGEWAAHSLVVRLDPTGDLSEEPGALSTEDHIASPPSSPATTRGALPKVLHRRRRTRPNLR